MAKKKRQNAPRADTVSDESSTCSSDDLLQARRSGCAHINKSVDLNRVKKAIGKGLARKCEKCTGDEVAVGGGGALDADHTLWMCLKCGFQGCGRSQRAHALQHFEMPHSEWHSLCVNTTRWSIWCYDCNKQVHVNARKKMQDCIEYVRKKKAGKAANEADFQVVADDAPIPVGYVAVPLRNEFCARGLFNLGNTCYFNAVVQCLGRTPFLLTLLEATSPTIPILLPGGVLTVGEKKIDVGPLESVIPPAMPLMSALGSTLVELITRTKSNFMPRPLFAGLGKKIPQFSTGEQQDAHELLRYLLEVVRDEEQQRYRSAIAPMVAADPKLAAYEGSAEADQIVRFYNAQATDFYLPTEQVFRGVLVSTLKCEECGHRSHRKENFLDLSLPILEVIPCVEPIAKPKKKNKKETKAQNKKANKRKSRKATSAPRRRSTRSKSKSQSESEEDENDDHVLQIPASVISTETGRTSDEDTAKTCENSPVPSVDIGDTFLANNFSSSNSLSSSYLSTHGSADDPIDIDVFDTLSTSECTILSEHNDSGDINCNLEKLSIEQICDMAGGENPCELIVDNQEEQAEETMLCTKLAPQKEAVTENSVLFCLTKFTSTELLTANNKVRCDLCTKRYGGPEKTPIYTNAMKQLLIYSPPAVLILHLKRFQVRRRSPIKLSKDIKFPVCLDIAPFCSSSARKLPTMDMQQEKVLYQLYGVVEHTGSMSGGHYVAYIKARKSLSEDSFRWKFVPKLRRKKVAEMVKQDDAEPSKWFNVSDAHVREVSESVVLAASAYLLFYERIF